MERTNGGDSMDTVTEATQRLQAEGYTANLYAGDDRTLRCDEWPDALDPAALQIDHVLRFEGASDPDDAMILFALQTTDGHRGVYSAAYGPQMSPEDAAIVRLLAHGSGHGSLDDHPHDGSPL